MTIQNFGMLNGQTAVVTGASSGIGREIALEFARAGADLIIHCRNSVNLLEKTSQDIRQLGQNAEMLTADFSEPDQLEGFAAHIWRNFGPVQLWVNNAGADLLTGPEAHLNFPQKLQILYNVDIRSSLILSRDIGQFMKQAGSGTILNIGWDQAERGMEGDSGELFAASKNAIMGFTRSLSLSLAPEVRVNCIAPGWIRTKWGEQAGQHWQDRVLRETPLNRWGRPEDIAKTARFLASPDAAYITGQIINVNGGAVR
ncbi:MAG: SDR family oxidoreductase [Planctomycetaceae bacterium]